MRQRIAWLLCLALVIGPAQTALGGAAAKALVAQAFERAGRRPPRSDGALDAAARTLVQTALRDGTASAADARRVSREVSRAGGFDPHPRALFIHAGTLEAAYQELARHPGLTSDAATHLGLASVVNTRSTTLVALLVSRRATIEAFPRQFSEAGVNRQLCGRLEAGYGQAEVVVTRPAGNVQRVATRTKSDGRFCARIDFPEEGSHQIEVLARGGQGPTVASLFLVEVGAARAPELQVDPVEPGSRAEARVQVLARINALRASHGAPPLTVDPALENLAQAYSQRMAREGFFAHVSPDGEDLKQRLQRAGYAHASAGENLGAANGPLAAHVGIEDSPAHRMNLLEPRYTHVGLGIAERMRPGGTPEFLLTEIFAVPARKVLVGKGELAATYDALDQRRRQRGLPALVRNEVLERLARDHAQRALEQQKPEVELSGPPLHDRIFEALPDVGQVAIDLYVTSSGAELPASENVSNAAYRQVGVGLIRGDSKRFGRNQAWVVIVYATGP